MLTKYRFEKSHNLFVGFENEAPPAPPADPPVDTPPELNNTAEFNRHAAEQRRIYKEHKTQWENREAQLLSQIAEKEKDQGNRDELLNRIEELETRNLTDQQKLERQHTNALKDWETQRDTLQRERDEAVTKYRKDYVARKIYDQASKQKTKPHDPKDIADLLAARHDVTWKELDDGHGNLAQDARVLFNDVDKDGKPVKAEYSLEEAVDRMYEIGGYAHLWEGHLKDGLGGKGNAGKNPNSLTPQQVLDDAALYERLKKESPALLDQIMSSAGA